MTRPRLASAVVLFRRREGQPEVFWVERGPSVSFMPGFHAFPGGAADGSESPEATAVRELAEETGVKVEAASLVPIGHWITPPFAPRRFDTRFYLAALPSSAEARVSPGELASGEWIRPGEAVARWERGEVLLAPPILHLLRVAAAEGDPGRWPALATTIPEADGGEVTCIEMRRGIVLVPLQAPTLPPATHVNCYVVGGASPVVVDPGSPEEGEQAVLDRVLDQLVREGRRPSRIVITHHHLDHVAGVGHLAARLKVPVAAHPITRDLLAGSVKVDQTLSDGELLPVGGAPLKVLHTPGHARGHLALVEEGSASLLSGDLILGLGTSFIDPPDGDLGDYLASLDRLAGMKLRALFPGHGPVLADALAKVREYLAHRQEREEQVLAALRAGDGTPEAIVERVYLEVTGTLRHFAARSVLAHLLWLERRGLVRQAEGRWALS